MQLDVLKVVDFGSRQIKRRVFTVLVRIAGGKVQGSLLLGILGGLSLLQLSELSCSLEDDALTTVSSALGCDSCDWLLIIGLVRPLNEGCIVERWMFWNEAYVI